MTKGNTLGIGGLRQMAWALPVLVLFVMIGVASGLWINVAILGVTVGIFLATVTLRKSERPTPGRVISLRRFGWESVEDLDEVA